MSENNTENPNFRLKPVADFLDGEHHFFIPSYQRGYRWDEKQVEDLLKDISEFAENSKNGDFYCLQPIVVKQWIDKESKLINGWEVIDGQQRLTTLYLLCKYLQKGERERFIKEAHLYTLTYQTRSINFDNIDRKNDIDSFYIKQTETFIKDWFDKGECRRSKIEEVIFMKNKNDNKDNAKPQVKFIWYVVENNDDLSAIKVFNNLNKGKIRLTNAELIKALFVLKAKKEKYPIEELILEWNIIENTLHDDKFWLFLTNKDYNPATRIDLIFDFLTNKTDTDDSDFPYRQFQSLYDCASKKCWDDLNINSFKDAWKEIKSVYQLFLFWFENEQLYHYIGYLLMIGVSHKKIYNNVHNLPKNIMVKRVKQQIKETLKISSDGINELSYDKRDMVRNILLLFNIESCAKSDANRFPFDLYKDEKSWDIEHIASKTDNKLQKNSDKIEWLNYTKTIVCEKDKWKKLQKEANDLAIILIETNNDEGNKFYKLYEEIINTVESEDSVENKDLIGNLTLLDARTNRSYGNALFQTKRQKILEKDIKGHFIPLCTKNVFLKYYTSDKDSNTQWNNMWSESDARAYEKKIINCISDFLIENKK